MSVTDEARTIVVGDLHGCRETFDRLLTVMGFRPGTDKLWLVGDLINRGPDSLGCLIRARELDAQVVLGNHDLTLLAIRAGVTEPRPGDTFSDILEASNADEWIDWLRQCPLLIEGNVADRHVVMTHAGIPPQWSLAQARVLAQEVETVLKSGEWRTFMGHMFGNAPARFENTLTGWDRLRAIINTLTRMRFIAADGTLDFKVKAPAYDSPAGLAPWFCYPRHDDILQVFGHWAALQGHADNAAIDVIATDSGCIWGNTLAGVVLETGQRIEVRSELA